MKPRRWCATTPLGIRGKSLNLNLNLPQEKIEVFALFLGSVLIASTISQFAFFLIQHKLLPPRVPLPFWLSAWPWLIAIYLATQIHNNLLRVAILSWGISMVVRWLMRGNESMAALIVHNAFHLLAGVLMVIVGIRNNRCRGYVGAFFLLVGFSVLQYFTAVNWSSDLEIIQQHQISISFYFSCISYGQK